MFLASVADIPKTFAAVIALAQHLKSTSAKVNFSLRGMALLRIGVNCMVASLSLN
jgi:hypothetical protein